ncbi:hypothetical protein OTU49_012935 [Cherax quadricarinatus]|uniref:Uncharacterized protein n=1 Tax=Cherax quadricarinatus TaxID=27406 RepID=A0AAW0VVJ7_CHEQU
MVTVMSDVMDTVKNDMIVTVKNDVMKIILLMVILWSTYMLQLVDAKVYKDSLDQPWNLSPESPGGLPESHSEPLEDPKIVSTGPEIVKDEHDINENPEIASKGFEHDKIDTSFPEGPDVIIPTHDDASKYSNMESEDTEVVSEGPKEVAEEPEDIAISPGNTEDVTDKASSNPEFIPDDGSSSSEDPIVVPGDDRSSEGPEEVSDVVVVALGGGEDLVVVAQIASLLNSQGHSVAAIVYGSPHRDEIFPPGVKDVLVPALLNRAGVVTVCPGGGEAWLGHDALHALYTALATTSYTVLWRAPYPHLLPNVTQDEGSNTASRPKFVFKETLPLTDVMNHPRHRLLISTCGETDTMAAVYFASPVLCLPVTADQTLAAAALQDLGIGTVVAAGEVTVTTLREALGKLAADRSYREKGRELAEELHDQPLSPADRLLFTLERVMRRPHSRRYMKKGSHLYLLQQSNADVYLLLLILLSSVTALLILLAIMVIPVLLKKQKIKEE